MRFLLESEDKDTCKFNGAFRDIDDKGVYHWYIEANTLDELLQKCLEVSKIDGDLFVWIQEDGSISIVDRADFD